MAAGNLVLVTGVGGVGRTVLERLRERDVPVRAMVRRDDGRADALRALGVEVVTGDLTRPETVAAALEGAGADVLRHARLAGPLGRGDRGRERRPRVRAAGRPRGHVADDGVADDRDEYGGVLSAAVALAGGAGAGLVGLPVVHIRPTSFLDNPLFTVLAARSHRENGTIALPFGRGRTSPVAAEDVARVVATVLRDPAPHVGRVYELTGPRAVDTTEMAEEFSRTLGREVRYVDMPPERWEAEVLGRAGLPPHVEAHIAAMGRLHRENRYDRASQDVERVTGVPARTVEQFVAARRGVYLG